MRRVALLLAAGVSAPTLAANPVPVGDGFSITPIIDARLRYEHVDQAGFARDGDAITLRARAGVEVGHESGFSFLAEGEGTVALNDHYNSTTNGRGMFPVVADPETIELNRLQVGYAGETFVATVGRQRILLGDSRFVGNVGWRENEQTFDAVRIQLRELGPFTADAAYAISERTIFGFDSGIRESFEGDFILLHAGLDLGPVDLTAFAYLLDHDASEPRARFDSQTYGLRATAALPISEGFSINLEASYARQSDYQDYLGPLTADYSADYILLSATTSLAGFNLTLGYEELGSDDGLEAVQTPLATLHKFNGWADIFLITPPMGLRDHYVTIGRSIPGVPFLPDLRAAVTYHAFDSDYGGIDYGSEWDALIGFRIGPFGALVKYANYDADSFGADVERLWAQLEYSF
ncbi:alginate export family protein [Parasphingopyxis marina]|uniref:Alginate export family protein n=1 Tax=Parasphingopyxis marina TaxID=2761622 RepID=A0A842I3T3_9SPHN|nr:alginate export family protein [Parasphingopyxis marina]MBC2779140.1 alginate export family protein [Parasphingopyxis marina]